MDAQNIPREIRYHLDAIGYHCNLLAEALSRNDLYVSQAPIDIAADQVLDEIENKIAARDSGSRTAASAAPAPGPLVGAGARSVGSLAPDRAPAAGVWRERIDRQLIHMEMVEAKKLAAILIDSGAPADETPIYRALDEIRRDIDAND